ncbi:SWIM zinc finger family protein, partial [Streptomyces puniciscabiei]|uniref:SWIM zinc finger family protein n=1 Tax=Streptomyces puniciscabiei TaxID=164348 RepID=UPI0033285772
MRHYLANAFRMPAWSDTPEEETPAPDTIGTDDGADTTRTSPVTAPAPPSPRTPQPATPTELGHQASASSDGSSAEPGQASAGSDRSSAEPGQASASSDRSPVEPDHTPAQPQHTSVGPANPRAGSDHPAVGPDQTPAEPGSTWGESASPNTPPATSTPTVPTPPASTATTPQDATPHRSAPAAAHVPATMGTPHRDTELRRTFPPFPPRETGAEDVPFAATWWGNAWVTALEQGALDPKRLARGRGYADQGHVDAITVTPGLVLAYVRGSRPRPYRVQVRVRTLEDADWARFLDAAADRPGHIAALLDKELPQSLADRGVPLLPGPGDLVPRCSCPDSGHPCKHAAALCYQTARLLDADPFVLLLLRGRGERNLLDALSRRSAAISGCSRGPVQEGGEGGGVEGEDRSRRGFG